MFNASHNCVVPKWPGHFWNWKCVRFWTCFLWNSLSTVNASVLKLGDTQVLNPTGIKECPLSLWLSHTDEDGWISILTHAKHCKHCLTEYMKLPVHANHAVVPCAQCISYKKYLLVTRPYQTKRNRNYHITYKVCDCIWSMSASYSFAFINIFK